MDEKNCPRCQAEITNNAPLYQCCRCFTYYCKKCEATNEGKNCPKCRMGARLVIASGK